MAILSLDWSTRAIWFSLSNAVFLLLWCGIGNVINRASLSKSQGCQGDRILTSFIGHLKSFSFTRGSAWFKITHLVAHDYFIPFVAKVTWFCFLEFVGNPAVEYHPPGKDCISRGHLFEDGKVKAGLSLYWELVWCHFPFFFYFFVLISFYFLLLFSVVFVLAFCGLYLWLN